MKNRSPRLSAAKVGRAEVEEFLFHEAALLDDWRLDDWLGLLTDDARYEVPSNDRPEADSASTLFTIADDINRIRGRITRLKDKNAHAEFPRSRTRRMISNVRITGRSGAELQVEANFVVYRFKRDENVREYVGRYKYVLRLERGGLKIARRRAVLDAMELGSMGLVSFVL
ncbi:MAG TPA: aromatic-ring-hydroxylating dioxygenase subunit beta [Burkholderiales bacterium]|nr:aromatic-ring-hydroxylating dioxygenase subunit beta [Burkholderiales bacterium]